MKKSIFFTVLAAAAFLSVGLPLEAKEYDNVLLYRKCGSWNHNGTLIDAGTDEGRITWDGKPLRFTPRGDDGFDLWKFLCFDFSPSEGTFDLQNFYSFGFAIRVPENMRDKPITVKFVYEEGKPSVWTLRTPPHTGWRSSVLKVNADKWPHLRPDKLKSVEFSSEVPGFQAWLDDIRFVRAGLDFQLHEEWLPPLTNGCFFPG